MKALVLILESKHGKVAYVTGKINNKTQHRINVIREIHGFLAVQIYDPNMDFYTAVNNGFKLILKK